MSLTQVKALPGLERAHLEVMRGKFEQNEAYCTKDEDRLDGPWRLGTPQRGQGTRTDLLDVKSAIDSGAGKKTLYSDHFATYVRLERAFNNYMSFTREGRSDAPVVLLIVGSPGAGKTRFAMQLASYLGTWYKAPSPKSSGWYFDNYDYEDVLIIDEMSGSKCTPEFFNQLIDRYPFEVPVHGGAGRQFISRYIIITANLLPKMWWRKFNYGALMRRITIVGKMLNPSGRSLGRPSVVYDPLRGQFIHQ